MQCSPGNNVALKIRMETWRRWEEKYRKKFKKQWSEDNFTVLASLSLVNKKTEHWEIISIGFGTKSLPESLIQQNERKKLIPDMHGEILAIQGFKHFVCQQIKKEKSQYLQFVAKKEKYKLKDQFQVFLYCSEVFCGDCCINEKQQSFSGAKPLKFFGQQKYPQLKYQSSILRTKPGRLDLPLNKRSRILSCSDLLAFCNLSGIQGIQLFNLVTPIYIHTVILDCQTQLRSNILKGIDFVTRLSLLKNKSEELIQRQLFNIIINGEQRKISGQFKRNRPEVILIDKHPKKQTKSRNQQGFDLCGIITESIQEWLNGKSGLPEGSSLKTYKTKGKISKFSDDSLGRVFSGYREGPDSFKYRAIEDRLRLLFGEWIDDNWK